MPYTEQDYWNMLGYQCYDARSRLDCVMWLLKKAIEERWPDKEKEDKEECPRSSMDRTWVSGTQDEGSIPSGGTR